MVVSTGFELPRKNALTVPIRYDLAENLLNNATSVSLRRQDADFNMPLDKRRCLPC